VRSGMNALSATFDKPDDFGDALRKAMSDAKDVDLLFSLWENNVDTVRALNKSLRRRPGSPVGVGQGLVARQLTL
jgi:hypothetical protein